LDCFKDLQIIKTTFQSVCACERRNDGQRFNEDEDSQSSGESKTQQSDSSTAKEEHALWNFREGSVG